MNSIRQVWLVEALHINETTGEGEVHLRFVFDDRDQARALQEKGDCFAPSLMWSCTMVACNDFDFAMHMVDMLAEEEKAIEREFNDD